MAYDAARVERIRRGTAGEPDDRAARYLIDELEKCLLRDPDAHSLATRHDALMTALEAVCARLGIPWRPQYPSLRAWGKNADVAGPPMFARDVAREQFVPLLDALDDREELFEPVGEGEELAGWDAVDDEVQAIREDFVTADSASDYANLARQCREVFVTLADLVYEEDVHGPLPERELGTGGGTVKARLGGFIRTEAAGSRHGEMRAVALRALDLANQLQHRRTTERWEAASLADATIFVVGLLRRLASQNE